MLPIDDFVIIGAGISGIVQAKELAMQGRSLTLLEAGEHFNKHTYPRKEIDANSKLYWGGGIELNHHANIGFLRPKVVGGGSIVNQALLDRFDSEVLNTWREQSGISFFHSETLTPWYEKAESSVAIQEIPSSVRNENANIFIKGFENLGFTCAPLKRAQKDCRYNEGNDCIQCLAGCPLDSKQSAAITALPIALKHGAKLESQFEAKLIKRRSDHYEVHGIQHRRDYKIFRAKKLILAAGAIGNSKLLLNSDFKSVYPMLGENFYTHPQFMSLGFYDKVINAHKGPFQAMKSAEPHFKINRFKLENVFAPPVGAAMLLPGFGRSHMKAMQKYRQYACIEVAIRDQNPGQVIKVGSDKFRIKKTLDERDLATKKKGEAVIHQIFKTTGAKKVIDGDISIGLHLMGGLALGKNPATSVVNENFQLHHHPDITCADSSVFPSAPGINPSLTIMALSQLAASRLLMEHA